jgi:hypothetical protein
MATITENCDENRTILFGEYPLVFSFESFEYNGEEYARSRLSGTMYPLNVFIKIWLCICSATVFTFPKN